MNTTRRRIRSALTAYEQQVHLTGRSTDLEMALYESLAAVAKGKIIDTDEETAKAVRLVELNEMIEEVAALYSPDLQHGDIATFEVDTIDRDGDEPGSPITLIYGTYTRWQPISADDDTWRPIVIEPYVIGRVR